MKYKPYVSIDIETTGLDPSQDQILQVAAVVDTADGTPIEKLPTLNILVRHERLSGNPFALGLNTKLINRIAKGEGESLMGAQSLFSKFLNTHLDPKAGKFTVAGKNAAGFDIPWLKAHGFVEMRSASHKILDPGPRYFPDFGFLPNLSQINERLGRAPVTHDAVDDCRDVIAAIRHKMGVK